MGEHKRGKYEGSNLGENYDSANKTQKKGISCNRHSSKTSTIPEKYISRSSYLVNQQVESLQKLTFLNVKKLKVACVIKIKLLFYGLILL